MSHEKVVDYGIICNITERAYIRQQCKDSVSGGDQLKMLVIYRKDAEC
jgi:hypothetical protein